MTKPNLEQLLKAEKIKNIEQIMKLYVLHLRIAKDKERRFYYDKIVEYGKMYKELTGKPYYISGGNRNEKISS